MGSTKGYSGSLAEKGVAHIPVVGPLINDAVALLDSIGISWKGKTQHISWNEADAFTRTFTDALTTSLFQTLSTAQLASPEFANIPFEVGAFIRRSNWWNRAVWADDPFGKHIFSTNDLRERIRASLWIPALWIATGVPNDIMAQEFWKFWNTFLINAWYPSLRSIGASNLVDDWSPYFQELADGKRPADSGSSPAGGGGNGPAATSFKSMIEGENSWVLYAVGAILFVLIGWIFVKGTK